LTENQKSTIIGCVCVCDELLSAADVRKFADDAHDEVHQHCDPKSNAHTLGHHRNGGHHHSHNAPGSVASVAWMVIVGDGFHNLADGLAIGQTYFLLMLNIFFYNFYCASA